jgi:NADP-dependent 3-hydroxy acid dehydrogenase YdfG
MKTHANKVVLVTGASQGLGREIALAFAREGARLVLAARSAERLQSVAEEIHKLGAEALAIPTDIADESQVKNLVEAAQAGFGRIDVVVNNAGIARVGGVESPRFAADLQQTMQASVFGMVRVTQAVLPIMRKQGSGAIVNMSSVMGRKAFARFGSYAMAMHAVTAFSDALRQELRGSNIQVCVIHPGLSATRLLERANAAEMPPAFEHMTPLAPELVARAVVQAVRRGRQRVVLPRMANMLLLGEAVSPRLGDGIARALTVKTVARLLGLSRGTTYHDLIPHQPLTADLERKSL